ncbi:MAG TPA: hypothetical protein VHG30_10050 [Microvirga sp.]|jgi:hypothetical protein|nr:hypothetical protein [Microvirga sp.]
MRFRIGHFVRLKDRPGIFEVVSYLATDEDGVPLYCVRGARCECVVSEHDIARRA